MDGNHSSRAGWMVAPAALRAPHTLHGQLGAHKAGNPVPAAVSHHISIDIAKGESPGCIQLRLACYEQYTPCGTLLIAALLLRPQTQTKCIRNAYREPDTPARTPEHPMSLHALITLTLVFTVAPALAADLSPPWQVNCSPQGMAAA